VKRHAAHNSLLRRYGDHVYRVGKIVTREKCRFPSQARAQDRVPQVNHIRKGTETNADLPRRHL
jgi:hypothetical protein